MIFKTILLSLKNMLQMIFLSKVYRKTNPPFGLSLLYTLLKNTRKNNFSYQIHSGNGIYIQTLHKAQTNGRICPYVAFVYKYLPNPPYQRKPKDIYAR